MDELQFSNLNQLKENDILTVQNLTKQTSFQVLLKCSSNQINRLKKGGLLNTLKEN